MAWDNTTRPEGRTPASSTRRAGGGCGECPVRARSTARADGLDKVRALQRVLYRSAKQQPHRRFHALFDKVARGDILERAWEEVRANRGAPGVDGVTIADVEASGVAAFLSDLAAALRTGGYRPAPLRRVHIPKPGQPGKTRPLGVPTVRDRVAMTAAKLVLEPVFEADFLPVSFGFRPRRSAHQACDAIRAEANRGADWGLDADVRDCLGGASHYPLAVAEGVEQPTVSRWDLDTQALSSPGADVDGAELAALDSLQHRLPGAPQRHGGLQHRQPALGGLLDEAGAQLVGDADPPGGARGGLLAGDEPVGQPPVHRRGRHPQDLGGLGDGGQLALWRGGGWLVAADAPVMPQALDDRGGKAQAAGAAAALAVEDAGDGGIGVVGRQPADQGDGVLVGAELRWVGAGQGDVELADRPAAPAHGQVGLGGVAVDGDDDLLE